MEKEHVLRTRNHNKSEIIFENLKMLQCTVCQHKELTDDSEQMVKIIRNKIRGEMKEKEPNKKELQTASLKADKTEKNHFSFVKEAVRKWIG